MKIIIIRETSVEYIEPKGRDRSKHFVKSWRQLYYTPPNGFVRMNRVRFGKPLPPEEVMIYSEGEIYPYHCKDIPYSMDYLLENIDMEKDMPSDGLFDTKPWYERHGGSIMQGLAKYGLYLFIGAVVVYAVISNGGL